MDRRNHASMRPPGITGGISPYDGHYFWQRSTYASMRPPGITGGIVVGFIRSYYIKFTLQ